MNELTDSLGRQIDYLPLDLVAGEETAVLRILITPSDKAILRVTGDSRVQVFVKDVDGDDTWVDLLSGVDLSPLPVGVPRNFDVKFKADGAITGQLRLISWIGVVKSSMAGWST